MSVSENQSAAAEKPQQTQAQIEMGKFMEDMKKALLPGIQEMIKSQMSEMMNTSKKPNPQQISTDPDKSGEMSEGEDRSFRDDAISINAESITASFHDSQVNCEDVSATAKSQNATRSSSSTAPRLRRKVGDDVASLLRPPSKKMKVGEEQNDIDMELEMFQKLDKEYQEEVTAPISDHLATRVKQYWGEHSNSVKCRKTVTEKYKLPANCETLAVPKLNKEIFQMTSFRNVNRRLDTDLMDLQKNNISAASVLANLADKVIKHDKEDKILPAADIVAPLLETIMLLGHTHTKLSLKRMSNIRSTLHSDIRKVCDQKPTQTSTHLLGDDWSKAVKDAKAESQVARMCENKGKPIYEGRWSDLEKNKGGYKSYKGGKSQDARDFLNQRHQSKKPPSHNNRSTKSKKN